MTHQSAWTLPIAAAAFAIPQFVPQYRRARRGAVSGVSWTWASLTTINNVAWIVYFTMAGLYAGIPANAAVVVFAGLLTHEVSARGTTVAARQKLIVLGWTVAMVAAGLLIGRTGLGAALSAAFFLQAMPSLWTAYRSPNVSGISATTWLLILGELTCFGLFGYANHDFSLQVLGVAGVVTSVLMLARVGHSKLTRFQPSITARQSSVAVALTSPQDLATVAD